MTKKILCIGDSFTYGDELKDRDNDSWPSVIGKKQNCKVFNLGMPGGSNEYSMRVLFESLEENWDLIIFSWTFFSRIELPNQKNKPVSISPSNFRKNILGNIFYGIHYDELYMYKKMLTQIILLQDFFTKNNQKFLFSMVFRNSTLVDDTHSTFLLSKIDNSKFIGYPLTLIEISQKFKLAEGGHPLEEGHEFIADLVIQKIKETYTNFFIQN